MELEKLGENSEQIAIISDIVAAYVSNNHVVSTDLPKVITAVHAAIVSLSAKDDTNDSVAAKSTPAQIRKSIGQDALVSFIDGKHYKTLKRHVANHGFTLDTYRAHFGLPTDYPATAPSYSQRRSALAKSSGLGIRHRRK